MRLDALLELSLGYERRSAEVYRGLAARHRPDPDLHALWTSLACEEEKHAAELEAAITWVICAPETEVDVEGWQGALDEIDQALEDAEGLSGQAGLDRELAAALALEVTEIDLLRELILRLGTRRWRTEARQPHGVDLAEQALQRSTDPEVRAYATMLLDRTGRAAGGREPTPRAPARRRGGRRRPQP